MYVIEPTTIVEAPLNSSLCLEPENDAIVSVPPLLLILLSPPGYIAPLLVYVAGSI